MREMRLFGSMSGNRKQSQAKPDCGDTRESRVISHRKTTAPAPVLDSTFFFALFSGILSDIESGCL